VEAAGLAVFRVEGNYVGCPANMWVVFVKPRLAKYDVEFTEFGNVKKHVFLVLIDLLFCFNDMGNIASG